MRRFFLALGLIWLSAAAFADPGTAGKTDGIEIRNAWARATPPNAPTGALYLVVDNHSERADRLLGGETEAAEGLELHSHAQKGSVMRMRRMDTMSIPANASVPFAPGANHIMLTGLKERLRAGETIPVVLRFEHAGEIAVEAEILPIGSRGPAADPGRGR